MPTYEIEQYELHAMKYRLCEEVCPSTLRPITPLMLTKAYEALRGGDWTVTNTVTGSSLLAPGS